MNDPLPSRMSALDAIFSRRSVRSYAAQSLDRSTIVTLLEAAIRAPTAVHEEPWAFVVVQDRGTLRRISERAKPLFAEEVRQAKLARSGHSFSMFSHPDFNIFYDAGTLIIICASPMGPFVVADCWLAAENLMVAACALGLGTCVIGSAVSALNLPEEKSELGIPPDMTAIAPIIVGVPSDTAVPSSRNGPHVLAWL
ncbi:MAG: nitroreductase family protein [Thiobacillaceae bacterium]